MENLYALITAALETDLHDLAVLAGKEWQQVKDQLEAEPEAYEPQEYPKMIGEKVVYNAKEEAALTGAPMPAEPEEESQPEESAHVEPQDQ